jgi:hypothetical protein
MFGIIYLAILLFLNILYLCDNKNKTVKDSLYSFNYLRFVQSMVILHIFLALAGVYSSFNIFGFIFLLGLLLNLILAFLCLVMTLTVKVILNTEKNIDGWQKSKNSLKEDLEKPFNIYKLVPNYIFNYIINIILIVGFYFNVKGGHSC